MTLLQRQEYLAEQIESLHKTGESYEDTAILYRLQRQGELLEKVFEKRGIPYQISVKQTAKDIPALDLGGENPSVFCKSQRPAEQGKRCC